MWESYQEEKENIMNLVDKENDTDRSMKNLADNLADEGMVHPRSAFMFKWEVERNRI